MKLQKSKLLTCCFSGLLLSSFALASAARLQKLTAAQAKDHIGERATVCGKVASARYAERSKNAPTFLNFDRPFPNQLFTVVIWGRDRPKFGQPEVDYKGKKICVTGRIESYNRRPEMKINEPSQISVEETEGGGR